MPQVSLPAILSYAFVATAPFGAFAVPVEVPYNSITPSVVENFDSYPIGPLSREPVFRPIPIPPPYVQFKGFSIGPSGDTGLLGWVSPTIQSFCASQCLYDPREVVYPHTLTVDSGVASIGLSLWNTYISALATDFLIEVVGNSGVLSFRRSMARTEWLGFSDPSGLQSITFTNFGSSIGSQGGVITNYGFDDVITSSAVPEPSSYLLMSTALLAACVGLFIRRVK